MLSACCLRFVWLLCFVLCGCSVFVCCCIADCVLVARVCLFVAGVCDWWLLRCCLCVSIVALLLCLLLCCHLRVFCCVCCVFVWWLLFFFWGGNAVDALCSDVICVRRFMLVECVRDRCWFVLFACLLNWCVAVVCVPLACFV